MKNFISMIIINVLILPMLGNANEIIQISLVEGSITPKSFKFRIKNKSKEPISLLLPNSSWGDISYNFYYINNDKKVNLFRDMRYLSYTLNVAQFKTLKVGEEMVLLFKKDQSLSKVFELLAQDGGDKKLKLEYNSSNSGIENEKHVKLPPNFLKASMQSR